MTAFSGARALYWRDLVVIGRRRSMLVAVALYVGMLSLVIRRCKRIWRDPSADPEHRGLAIGTAAGVVAICVHSLFGNSIFTTFVMEILWVSWGLIFVIARELRGRATAEA